MKPSLGVTMITKNAGETLEKSIKSVTGWVREIVIVDSYSTDNTLEIAKKHKIKVFQHQYEGEGSQRNFALTKMKSDWILALDADELVTINLKKEILKKLQKPRKSGYFIPIQSHYLKRKLHYGGENYQKMVLFRKSKGFSTNNKIHAVYKVKDKKTGIFKNKLYHYSYQSLWQTLKKFTEYAFRESSIKSSRGERSSFKKIFLYPVHMFWSRYSEDKGYKDGFFRIPLDLAFGYMEFLTYFLLFFKSKFKSQKSK